MHRFLNSLIIILFLISLCILFIPPEGFYHKLKVELSGEVPDRIKVVATMYNPTENQCDSTPLITASGAKIVPRKIKANKWIAVSRNLLSRWGGPFDYGDKVRIENAGHKSGVYTIMDTMNKRYINRIDFLEPVETPLYKFNNAILIACK